MGLARLPVVGPEGGGGLPVLAVVLAVGLIVGATLSAEGAIAQVQSVTGTGGATLLSGVPRHGSERTTSETRRAGRLSRCHLPSPGSAVQPIEGSTSLALPDHPGWVANGSAGAGNGLATVGGGLLHVGLRHPTRTSGAGS